MNDPRRNLADAQRALLAAVRTGVALAGFDESRLAMTSTVLRRKRRGGVARYADRLRQAMGDSFAPTFDDYATRHPLPAGGITEDAVGFARFICLRSKAPPIRREAARIIRRARWVKLRAALARLWRRREPAKLVQ